MGFDTLGLSDPILRAIAEMGYENPTPIQEKAIPSVFMARDILGCAQTGTGKTASFTLPMIDILAQGRSRARMPRSLILSPTRELAQQIAENFEMYGKYTQLEMALLIGGTSMREQEQAIDKGVDVLIATPGRLLDLCERGRIMLNDVKILVIDEADRMMDMGFIPDIEKVVASLPANRQTLFFSATMAPEIRKIADQFLHNPKEITVSSPQSTAVTVKHFLTEVGPRNKRKALRHFIASENVKNAFVFCNRKRDISVLVDSLQRHGHEAVALHGDLSQSQRNQSLDYFRAGNAKFLVCSDVAARGIDISDLSHVFNFDVPFNAEDYVHRIGRTGRAGKEGRAFTIATPHDDKLVAAIETLIGTKIERVILDNLAPGEDEPAAEDRGRNKRGATSSGRDRGKRKQEDDSRKLSREEKRRARSSHPADRDVGDMPSDPAEYYRDDDTADMRQARSAFEAHVPAFFLGELGWFAAFNETSDASSPAEASATPQDSARDESEQNSKGTKGKRKPRGGNRRSKRSPAPSAPAQTPTGADARDSVEHDQAPKATDKKRSRRGKASAADKSSAPKTKPARKPRLSKLAKRQLVWRQTHHLRRILRFTGV